MVYRKPTIKIYMGYELTFWPTFNNNRGQLYRAFQLLNTVDYVLAFVHSSSFWLYNSEARKYYSSLSICRSENCVQRQLGVDQGSKLCKWYKSYLDFVCCEYLSHRGAFRTWDVSSYGIVWNCNVLLFVLADVSQCFISLKTELLSNHNWSGRCIIFSGLFSIFCSQIRYKIEVCHKSFSPFSLS